MMKVSAKHTWSLLGLMTFIILALGSFSKTKEPCVEKPVYTAKKDVYVYVYDRLLDITIPEATVNIYVRDHNPSFIEPDECDFINGLTIENNTSRTTDINGYLFYQTIALEHDNSKDYTEITIEVSKPGYESLRSTKVLYYDHNSVSFTARLINKMNQP